MGARIKRVAEPQFEGQRVKCIPLIVFCSKISSPNFLKIHNF